MTSFGYTMLCEQSRPNQLVRDVKMAEDAGIDVSVCTDRYQPWLDTQEHSGCAWPILGAAAQDVERIRPFPEAGFGEGALVPIEGEQPRLSIERAQAELLPALRGL